jgi:hypothetical protein
MTQSALRVGIPFAETVEELTLLANSEGLVTVQGRRLLK